MISANTSLVRHSFRRCTEFMQVSYKACTSSSDSHIIVLVTVLASALCTSSTRVLFCLPIIGIRVASFCHLNNWCYWYTLCILFIYTVSQKRQPFYFSNNSQKLTDFNDFWRVKSRENLTSIACSHFTLINPKKVIFQQYYSYILQIIYIISEENKLLPPYPPHRKNVRL